MFARFLLLGSLLAQGACALPHGSFARPVNAAAEGTSMIAVGGLVPFAVTVGDTDDEFSSSANNVAVVPAASYDYAMNDGEYLGVEVSLLSSLTTENSDTKTFGLYINPRWELPLNGPGRSLSLTIDGNFGWVSVDDNEDAEIDGFPIFAPTVGLRWYLATGFGGAILSQQLGTGFITVFAPGSLAYDVPIPLGNATLHLFPEVRWDPTFLFVGDQGTAFIALFSGGLSAMLEL